MLSLEFYLLINMNITASLAGIIILLLRKIPKMPKSVISLLWAIPVIRLIFPFSFTSRYSIFTPIFLGTTKDLLTNNRQNYHITIHDYYIPGFLSTHLKFTNNQIALLFASVSLIWFIISLFFLITLIRTYFHSVSEFRSAHMIRKGIYQSTNTQSPVLAGMFSPKIILPYYDYSERTAEYIIMHEQMHIRRKDNLKRMLLLLIACFHWFNPLILYMIKTCLSDIEFACDEAVLRKCGEDKKKEYASAIVDAAEAKNILLSAFGGFRTKKRISFILSYKKASELSVIFFFILTFFTAFALLTNAAVIETVFSM